MLYRTGLCDHGSHTACGVSDESDHEGPCSEAMTRNRVEARQWVREMCFELRQPV